MSKFLWCSQYVGGLAIAYQISQQGHDVIAWIEPDVLKGAFEGMLRTVDRWEDVLSKERIVVVDLTGAGNSHKDTKPTTDAQWNTYTNLPEQLSREGFSVIGGGVINDRMEFDRTWGAQLAKRAGLLVPTTHRFEDVDKAIAYVTKTKQRYIMKPHGTVGPMSNYPAKDWTDMVAFLEFSKESEEDPPDVMELQEWIDGQQMAIESWVVNGKFTSVSGTFEFKPLLAGGHGPFTGETGSMIFPYPIGDTSKMVTDVLQKFEPMLAEIGYPDGPLDFNCIVNENGAYFLEFSPRFGYPSELIQLAMWQEDWGEAFQAIADGTFKGFTPKPQKWYAGVLVTVPKWPYESKDDPRPARAYHGAPMFHRLTKAHLKTLYPMDVYKENGQFKCFGSTGELCLVTGTGDSLDEAEAKMYQVVNEIELYSMMWRGDIGKGLKLEDLHRWGYWLPAIR